MAKTLEQLEQAYLDASRAVDAAEVALEKSRKDWNRLIVCKPGMRLFNAEESLRDGTANPGKLHRAVLRYRDAKMAYDGSGVEKQTAKAEAKNAAAQRAMLRAEEKADKALEALQRAAVKLPLSA
jgi:hypothetical protein